MGDRKLTRGEHLGQSLKCRLWSIRLMFQASEDQGHFMRIGRTTEIEGIGAAG